METRSQAGGRFGWIGAGVVGWAGVGSGMEKRSRARTSLRVASAVVFCWEVADRRCQASPTWPWVGGRLASWLLGWSVAWAWARVVVPARLMAASVAAASRFE
jgi:hypothetical protein